MTLAKFACSLLLVVSYVVAAYAQDLSGFFKGVNAAFVLYDLNHNVGKKEVSWPALRVASLCQ